MDHRFNGVFQGLSRRDCAVCLNKHTQAIEIRAITDAHIFNFIIDATYRRKNCVKCNSADIHAFFLMRLFRYITQSTLRTQFKLKRDFAGNICNVLFWIQYLRLTGYFEICGCHRVRSLDRERYGLWFIGKNFESYPTDIEKHGYGIFFHALDGRKFMRYIGYLDVCYCGAGQRRQNYTTQRIPQRITVARIESVNLISTALLGFGDGARL
ncbi:MAG: hypothetical protein UY46_C0011G0008 [Candidatus Kaiserbacteria bacterium GW2011_GWA2_49_56]|uniref:Uncharacterized protein n=1 Tax=Candidatus Kaiserbacteria bacterium GW2011_GWA2_49_56 TaxID=1618670 RepID=A0A0G1VPM8_9BACT|nr:MAG: hypothetical protein UY46_C0011G0008 [Candidatus Kaiserbacteria bacterium GW2011_GWA2_49_56]